MSSSVPAPWPRSALGGCSSVLMNPQGPIAAQEKTVLLNALAIMLVIVVPTILATLLFAWWYRASNTRAHYRPTFAYSGRVEMVTWSIPDSWSSFFLGGLTWIGSHKLDPCRAIEERDAAGERPGRLAGLEMAVHLPRAKGIASVNELVVPAGTPIHFKLTSASVMNTFASSRQLGGMIYTMNGMADELYLQADHPGVYAGRSAHFSGDGFSDMHFDVRGRAGRGVRRLGGSGRVAAGRRSTNRRTRRSPGQTTNVAPSTYSAVSADSA